MEKHEYQVSLNWKEGRIGEMSSEILPSKIEVATPPEFDNGVPGIWSPEHLYTASVLSCYMTTFLAVADFSKLEFESFDCDAKGILEKVEGKFLMTEIYLKATLKINDIDKSERAERILQKSEAACLISNSIKTKVFLDYNIH
ncbi:MAG: OsmC family peroxiredoxin [Bacteroidetes bacterium]|nr:MAG: OsmC family peroxiredoxin [Bacteroidota bacterium]MBL1145715.1 OsmC family peroxiredoxin [Bacteroidota bacterium]MCB0802988.1 OsmC family protein [Flavobacteriales bacterium]NOG58509.1 OsmC family peroxiredoxin [Bacteroidota bacterium]